MAALKPVFTELGDELAKVGIAFRTFEGGEKAFGDAKKSGDALGGGLAKVVGVATKLAIVGISVGIALLRFADWVGRVVDKLGGLETIVKVVEIALVGMAVRGAANASISLANMGVSAYQAIGGLRGVAAQAKGVSSVAGGFTNIRNAANSSIGKVEAVTAALVALYIAYDQWQALQKEASVDVVDSSGKKIGKSDGWSEMGDKFRHDLGGAARAVGFSGDWLGITDAEYERRLGISSGVQLNAGTGKRTTADAYRVGDGLQRMEPKALSDPYRVGLSSGSPLDAAMAKAAASAKSTATISVAPGASAQSVEAAIKALGVDKATADTLRQSAQMQLEAAQLSLEAAQLSRSSDLD
jgi:hypothetical protein